MFEKILIANRGEIACRVIRTARHMGIRTVAVYSDADATALHVKLADEAVHIGGAAPADSYLRMDAVLNAALLTGAEAIHPGYGFLSENAEFSRLCAERNVVFIGPPAEAIRVMGSKSAAKRAMEAAGVPLLPGYHGEAQDDDRLRQAASDIGYPVLLKAVAGGGGKGMRRVSDAQEFDEALAAARREALSAFGNDDMLVEKMLERPRHVELQVFCDQQGHGIYLFERDCSIQRRHQKIIEEAPAPGISDTLRQRMGESAVQAALAVHYVGAGTVEFLLDTDGSYYFMEMNTRLQVEHPVTEMITGQDLVEWQIRVADGAPLPRRQDELGITGHSFEARIYAEDPSNHFLPAAGQLDWIRQPRENRHVRVDTGVQTGDVVGVYYDPMIAKLIVWDENRSSALNRLHQALIDYQVAGVTTNIHFLKEIAASTPFRQGDISTDFLERHKASIRSTPAQPLSRDIAMAALYLTLQERQSTDQVSPWSQTDYFRPNGPKQHQRILETDDATHLCRILETSDHQFEISVDAETFIMSGQLSGNDLDIVVNGHRVISTVTESGDQYVLFADNTVLVFGQQQPDLGEDTYHDDGSGCRAPMNGTIVDVLVRIGEQVVPGQTLVIMEAMKMEHAIKAPAAGQVREVYFGRGDLVDGGVELVAIDPDVNGV